MKKQAQVQRHAIDCGGSLNLITQIAPEGPMDPQRCTMGAALSLGTPRDPARKQSHVSAEPGPFQSFRWVLQRATSGIRIRRTTRGENDSSMDVIGSRLS